MMITYWGSELILGFYYVAVSHDHARKRGKVYWVGAKKVSLPEMIKLWGKP